MDWAAFAFGVLPVFIALGVLRILAWIWSQITKD